MPCVTQMKGQRILLFSFHELFGRSGKDGKQRFRFIYALAKSVWIDSISKAFKGPGCYRYKIFGKYAHSQNLSKISRKTALLPNLASAYS